jgi:Domain of unknown function (DUF4760)
MTLDHWADAAQLATAAVALGALGAAVISIRTQRNTAKRRAAIDVFLKTEMDKEMLKAWRRYKSSLKKLKRAKSIEEFAQDKKSYQHIVTYLDISELISVGINKNVFDQGVCYGFWSTVLTDLNRDADAVIQHARQEPHGEHAYDELIRVNARWSGPEHFWQCWRR